MKKSLFAFVLAVAALLLSGCFSFSDNSVVASKKVILNNLEPSYDWSYKADDSLSKQEACDNINNLFYIIETSYAGYNEAVSNGLDCTKAKQELLDYVNNQNSINTLDLAKQIKQVLTPFIVDCHFSFYKDGASSVFMTEHHNVYFSDVYVSKQGTDYIVVKADNKALLNTRYTDSQDYLFYYPTKDPNTNLFIDSYRLGIWSTQDTDTLIAGFNSVRSPLKLHKATSLDLSNDFEGFEIETENSAYIRLSSFGVNEGSKKAFEDYMSAGYRFHDKSNIIIDVRGNLGGDDSYSQTFLYNLYMNAHNYESGYGANLAETLLPSQAICYNYYSPLSTNYYLTYLKKAGYNSQTINFYQKQYNKAMGSKKTFVSKSYNKKPNNTATTYKGKIYILMDDYTASSGESTVQYAEYFFGKTNQVILVGQNTMGCNNYGNVCRYKLSPKGLVCQFGSTDYKGMADFLPNFKGESYGYTPDYWAEKQDIVPLLEYLTGDSVICSKIKD